EDVRELLREWKRDRRELLRRFDANRDGEIDPQEWEAARRAAVEQVRAVHVEQSLSPDLHVLPQPHAGGNLVDSTLDEATLVRRWRRWGRVLVMAGTALIIAIGGLLSLRGL